MVTVVFLPQLIDCCIFPKRRRLSFFHKGMVGSFFPNSEGLIFFSQKKKGLPFFIFSNKERVGSCSFSRNGVVGFVSCKEYGCFCLLQSGRLLPTQEMVVFCLLSQERWLPSFAFSQDVDGCLLLLSLIKNWLSCTAFSQKENVCLLLPSLIRVMVVFHCLLSQGE